jgi:hypothetical protein
MYPIPPVIRLSKQMLHGDQTPTLLTFTCTRVLWFLSRLTRPRTSETLYKTHYYFDPRNPVYGRRLDPSVLAFSLSLYRHSFIYILFSTNKPEIIIDHSEVVINTS